MFLAWCDARNQYVLIGPSYIRGLTNTGHGMSLSYICDCGQPGQMRTGTATRETITGHTALVTSASKAPTAA